MRSVGSGLVLRSCFDSSATLWRTCCSCCSATAVSACASLAVAVHGDRAWQLCHATCRGVGALLAHLPCLELSREAVGLGRRVLAPKQMVAYVFSDARFLLPMLGWTMLQTVPMAAWCGCR